MNFKLTLEIDSSAEKKAKLIIGLSQKLNDFFQEKKYGNDLEEILIGIICIKTKPGYENWFKERKPKYVSFKKSKNKLTGVETIISKSFSYDVKIDDELYDKFVEANELNSFKILSNEILNSFSNFEKLPKKDVKDFDKEKFIYDVKTFFESYG